MKLPITRVSIDVSTTEARRDRVEREVFARLDAMRDVDRVATLRPPSRSWRLPASIGLAVAAAVVALLVVGRERSPVAPSQPSRIVTPSGGSSRFTIDHAIVDTGSDTSVEVTRDSNGGTTLVLARGSVDCDVTPRRDRPPFRVIAGDVVVEVVGTRFTVRRDATSTRVDVTRGKVRVHGRGEQRLVEAGEAWSSATTSVIDPHIDVVGVAAEPPTPPALEPAPEIELPAESMRGSRPQPSPRAAFEAAQRLERTDPKQAARAYRSIANGKDAYATIALLNLAELHATSDASSALRALDELARRFPRAANREEAAWLRVDVLRTAGRFEDARREARAYLEAYPGGAYARLADRVLRSQP